MHIFMRPDSLTVRLLYKNMKKLNFDYFTILIFFSELHDIKSNSTILRRNVRIEIKCRNYLSLFFIP